MLVSRDYNAYERPASSARRARADRIAYKLRNLPTHLREAPRNTRLRLAHVLGAPLFETTLHAVLHRADGSVVDLGLLSRKIVTTAGVNYLATCFIGTVEPETVNFHDSGTGTTTAVIADTALQTASGLSRVSGTQSNPSANIYRSVATVNYTSSLAITEFGIFSASTSGTLFDHFVFAAINVLNGDSITFTFNLTLTAGS